MDELQDMESIAEFRASSRTAYNRALYEDGPMPSKLGLWLLSSDWTKPSNQQRIRGQVTFIDGSGCECSCVSGEYISVKK